MNNGYVDIRDRIQEPVLWWDENAVPRYCEFGPDEAANIYADAVALVCIECQDCGAAYRVAFSESKMSLYQDSFTYLVGKHERKPTPGEMSAEMIGISLEARIRSGAIHYGDPPNGDCCMAGPTMNSIPRQVLEFWRRDGFDFVRVPELELAIDPEWAR